MEKEIRITASELEAMKNTDIRDIEKSSLVDISDINIDASLPYEERIVDYINQIKNPYCYCDHGMIIKIEFAGKRTLEDCILDCIALEGKIV